MLKKSVVDLLNQELDGTNGPKDSAVVKRLLTKNAEAKQYYDDLQSVVSMFKQIPAAEPPAHLKKNILSALHFPVGHAPVRPARKPFLDGFFASPRFRTAYIFAAGAVTGMIVFALLRNAPTDSAQMVGTLAPKQPEAVAEATAELHLDQVSGTITATEVNTIVTADVNLQSAEEIDVILNFDEHQLKFDTFRPDGNTRSIVTLLDGQVRLTLTGQHRYAVSFVNDSNTMPSLTAKLYAKGVLLSSYDLSLQRKVNH